MTNQYRASEFIDFDSGELKLHPSDLQVSTDASPDEKLRAFEARVDVWMLGVAVAMLKEIDTREAPSIWQHAAYGMLSVSMPYFEMLGKTLNPESETNGTAGVDFRFGFQSVYPQYDRAISDAAWVRIRNGLYHVGYTKNGLLISGDYPHDFAIDGEDCLANPHLITRTIVEHFPGFIRDVRADADLRGRFVRYFDNYFTVRPPRA